MGFSASAREEPLEPRGEQVFRRPTNLAVGELDPLPIELLQSVFEHRAILLLEQVSLRKRNQSLSVAARSRFLSWRCA